ncbi:MAG: ATPase, partial [Spirochaetaceae bacterium]|nr:ATPase [Spirochaetaceae bacterium]
MKEIYQIPKDELLKNVNVKSGLTTEKAKEILEKDGKNVLQESKKKSAFSVFLGQFADLLVIILIIAAIISMLSGNIESTIVIFAVILMNAILGTVQYIKAEKSLESLKALSSPHVKVLRDGIKQEILSKDVVKG